MIFMETHDQVPNPDVGAFVQQCLAAGAILVVVTKNSDGRTCTISVQRE